MTCTAATRNAPYGSCFNDSISGDGLAVTGATGAVAVLAMSEGAGTGADVFVGTAAGETTPCRRLAERRDMPSVAGCRPARPAEVEGLCATS